MKEFTIKIEVDDNITLEEIEDGVWDMIENKLATTEGTYEIEVTKGDRDMINKIRTKAYEYEKGKMMRNDSRVEIDNLDGNIWISDYSPSRESAELIEMICTEDDVNIDELVKMCEDEGFMYCI